MLPLCFLPPLGPDEPVYSFLGKVVSYNALTIPKIYTEQLFGDRNIITSVDLPTKLSALQQNLGRSSPWTSASDMIESATLYPYHRPFLSPTRHDQVEAILLNGGGKALKALMGRVANRFGASPSLRYCVKCARDDHSKYGSVGWRRSQQLPGVCCCSTHGIRLALHSQPSKATDRKRFVLPPNVQPNQVSPEQADPFQIWFSKISRDLLMSELPALDPHFRTSLYVEAIHAAGFRFVGRTFDYRELAESLLSHYSNFASFEHQTRLLSSKARPLAWMRTLLERPQVSVHPICHLLVMGRFFGSIANFKVQVEQHKQRFGLAPDGGVRPEGSIRNRNQHSPLLADQSLSCRSVSAALGLSVTTVVARRRELGIPIAERPKRLTSDLIASVKQSLLAETTPSDIVAEVGVSLSTVYRIRAQIVGLANTHAAKKLSNEREKHRRLWQHAISSTINEGIVAARRHASATYAWLYRNDRNWLMTSRPARVSKGSLVDRVDWTRRDLELSDQIKRFIENVTATHPRPRLSKTLLMRQIGESMVRANINKLPRLKALLEKCAEDISAYQVYRITLAVKTLLIAGVPLSLWRLQREAGLRNWSASLRQHALAEANRLSPLRFE